MLGNRSLRVDYAAERAPKVETQPYHKLYVYDWYADEDALRGAFQQFLHNITSVHMSACSSTHSSFLSYLLSHSEGYGWQQPQIWLC